MAIRPTLQIAIFGMGLLFVSAATTHAKPTGLSGFQVVRVTVSDPSDLATLRALEAADRDVEIWTDGAGYGAVEVRIPVAQKRALDAAGLVYEVVIQDLQATYDELFAAGEGAGFFNAYRSYGEHVAFMTDLSETYPDLATMVNLGQSHGGRILWALRIAGQGGEKPAVLYHGAQHGNEVLGPCVVAYLAQHLLAHYDDDPTAAAVVNGADWFLLPIMNPDGYESGSRYNAERIDLNRNWGGPLTGPSAFSEPETTALRDFLLAHPNVRMHVDLHSSGRMIMWPWGHSPHPCNDHHTFRALGDVMAEHISELHRRVYDRRGPINTELYPVVGGSVDYSYDELRLWGFVLELGSSHTPPSSQILPISEDITRALISLSAWVVDCNGNELPDIDEVAQGKAADCNDNGTPDVCESDLDGDTAINACDPDIDDDGVPNDVDACPYRPLGSVAAEQGYPRYDYDGDCAVDLADYQMLHDFGCLMYAGPAPPQPPTRLCLTFFDWDEDRDVDLADFAAFQRAFLPDPGW